MAAFNQLNATVTDLQAQIKNYETEISDLKWELDRERELNAAIKSAAEKGALPPKGVECTGCKHCIIYVDGMDVLTIGCDKDISCKDFEPSEHIAKKFEGRHRWGRGNGRINGVVTISLNSVDY